MSTTTAINTARSLEFIASYQTPFTARQFHRIDGGSRKDSGSGTPVVADHLAFVYCARPE
jgi:hypothetical protein